MRALPLSVPASVQASVLLSAFAVVCSLGAPSAALGAEPATEEEKALYALGVAVAQNVASFQLTPAELEIVKSGFTDGAMRRKPKLEPSTYFPKLREMQTARVAAVGKEALDRAAAEKGATRTPSGLIYKSVKEGQGAAPKASDTVKVHYHGTLPDGAVFDSSVERNEPASFPLNGVIACWTEGLQLMKVGGKGRLVCPAATAYGDRGAPPQIPPGATLIFDVELLGIEAAAAPEAKPEADGG